MTDQSGDLIWRDDLPVSRRFDDPYFAASDGLAETRHVFLQGNGLPARFAPGFRIAELGFGTGLNLLAAQAAWIASGIAGDLHFTSFEAHPLPRADIARALRAFPEIGPLAAEFLAAYDPAGGEIALRRCRLDLVLGDANVTLPLWRGRAEAWFLDGFAPARNPELWGDALLCEVARHTAPGGTAATYSAAGAVRRGLHEAGFDVMRLAGYGRKRHMTGARLP